MICPTKVNRRRHRNLQRAKDADRLYPKGKQPGCSTGRLEHTDIKAAGVEAGTTSLVSFKRNKVSPMPCLLGGRHCRKARCWGSGYRILEKANAVL